MKSAVVVLVCLWAAAAAAQSYGSVLNSDPVIFEIPSHAGHASFQPLASPQNILAGSEPSYARGVRPLWEFPASAPVPLGDVARLLRKQHELARKADKVFSDQR
ncbi:MAG: hypothetical protein JO266_12765 [Acidobacteria bacterium]|nr:hypothetical protein [Acidobacteriota bacterium]MBV8892818.1 hypothetical protein [Acidobacteriota bacterium]MBV9480226.1 hypothetical protein [Acidobacteriota bacterium]